MLYPGAVLYGVFGVWWLDSDPLIGEMSAPYHAMWSGSMVERKRTPDPCASSGGGGEGFPRIVWFTYRYPSTVCGENGQRQERYVLSTCPSRPWAN